MRVKIVDLRRLNKKYCFTGVMYVLYIAFYYLNIYAVDIMFILYRRSD